MGQEKTFEKRVKKYLSDKAWFVKFFANGYTKSGIPDILCCINGFLVAIEVKGDDGKPSALQLENIKYIRANKGIAFVLYPHQFDEFTKLVDLILNNNITVARSYQKVFD